MDLHNFSLRMLRTSNLSFGKHNSSTRFCLESQDMLKELLKVLSGSFRFFQSEKWKVCRFFPRRLGSLSFPTHFFPPFMGLHITDRFPTCSRGCSLWSCRCATCERHVCGAEDTSFSKSRLSRFQRSKTFQDSKTKTIPKAFLLTIQGPCQ